MASKTTISYQTASKITPFCIMTFGAGWLVGAGASWGWGALIVVVSGIWQASRNDKLDRAFVVDEED